LRDYRSANASLDGAPLYCYHAIYEGEGLVARAARYDNEQGKGDHRHLGSKEEAYSFSSIDRLLDDFERDIKEWRPT
jgi:hypothetical protein